MVALGLIEIAELLVMLRFGLDHFGERPLRRSEAAEGVVLVDLAELCRQGRWRDAVADLPAGAVIGLAETGNDEGAFAQLRITQDGFVAGAAGDEGMRQLPSLGAPPPTPH